MIGGAVAALRASADGNRPPEGLVSPSAGARSFTYEPGGAWVLDGPGHVPAVWGEDDRVLWSMGEPCYIAGVTGVGKTTIAAQLVFARLGLFDEVLGFPVTPAVRNVLVLASDRPRQAQRAYGRLADPSKRALLDERLAVWKGPPGNSLAAEPGLLREMCEAAEADTVILDSLVNMVGGGLTDDAVAGGLNQAIQLAISADIEVLALHHMTKVGTASGTTPQIESVYGSTFITAGAGSVIALQGRPGSPIVTLHHLKQPAGEVGPLTVTHDHGSGRSRVTPTPDLERVIEMSGNPAGLTVSEVAEAVFGTSDPTEAQKKKIKRQLDSLVRRRCLVIDKPRLGGAGGSSGARYRVVAATTP